jgi:hypothetical protein
MKQRLQLLVATFLLASMAGAFVFVGRAIAQSSVVIPILKPVCYIKYTDRVTQVPCSGKISIPLVGEKETGPDFDLIAHEALGHGVQNDKCYIISDGNFGIVEDNILGGAFCTGAATEAGKTPTLTPAAPTSGSSPAPTSGSNTPSTSGNAPISNNAQAADPNAPQIKREDNGGFDSVDDKCNVGNQGRDCAVTDRLNAIANVLSAGVGIIVVIMIIVSGIQYTMAGSDPQKIATAKGHILNAIIALIAFFFLYAFLQWLVPGGIF